MEKLQSSSFTVADNFSASICTLFSFLTPQQQQLVNNSKEIRRFVNTVSSGRIIESLVQQSIGFTTSPHDLLFGEQLKQIAQNQVPFDDLDQWRIIVNGPCHSGKSTMLSLIAKEAIQSLTPCNKLSSIFIFSVNWESATQRLTDIYSLYEFLATQTVYHLAWQYPRIFPVFQSLLSWLLSIPSASILPTLSLRVQNMPLFPTNQIEVFGKKLFNSFKNLDHPTNLLNEIVSFPTTFTSCFGYTKFLMIYDHIDLCNMDVRVSEESSESVCIVDSILSTIGNNLFFFSVKAPEGMNELLKDFDYSIIHIEHSISPELTKDVQPINCLNPDFELTIDMCQGCPQFINKYYSIAQYIDDIEKLVDEKQKKRGFKSIVTKTKLSLAKTLAIELITDLYNNGSINDDLFNEIQGSDEFTISVGKSKIF